MGSEDTPDFKIQVKMSREHFSSQNVLDAIQLQSEETLQWLRKNVQSYDSEGNLDQRTPWWTVPCLPKTEISRRVLEETRNRVLRDRVYEHGMQHFLHGLSAKGVIGQLSTETIDVVVNDATTPVVVNQLVARKYTKDVPDGVKLSKLRDLYGHGAETKPAKIRDRVVKRLHPIGVLTVRYSGEYDISLGPVAKAFWIDVYLPVVSETNINIGNE